MQSSVPPIVTVTPRQSSLEQFDPLSNGQLVLDDDSTTSNRTQAPDDDDLLKEWNLDFNPVWPGASSAGAAARGLYSAGPRGGINVQQTPSSAFVSMPNLSQPPGARMPMRYPAYGGYVPAVRPSSYKPKMNPSMMPMNESPVLARLAQQSSAIKSATLPPGLNPATSFAATPMPPPSSQVETRASVECGNLVDLLTVDNLSVSSTGRGSPRPVIGGKQSAAAARKSPDRWEKFD